MTLDLDVLRKLERAKIFYELALNFFETKENNEEINSGVILLQDSVELFLIGVCEYLDINYNPKKINFPEYLNIIKKSKKTFNKVKNEFIVNQEEKEMPFIKDLIYLNNMRVNIKHHGKLFISDDCIEIKERIHSFFIEASRLYFGLEFDEISLINILEENEIKKYLKEAEDHLINQRYLDCMINCRKILYRLFERKYDIRKFAKERIEDQVLNDEEFRKLYSDFQAPEYAKSRDYIDKNVSDPTEYIVIDYMKLNIELLEYGINTVDFYNVVEYTPKVYYFDKENRWAIKKRINYKITKEMANYCFRKTLNFTLLVRKKRKQEKGIIQQPESILIEGKEWEIFSKALRTSKNVHKMQKEDRYHIIPLEEVDGLKENRKYIHILLIKIKDNMIFRGFLIKDLIKKYL